MVDLLDEINAKVIFSIHGAQTSTHDVVTTVQDSCKMTTRAIEKLVAKGIQTQLHVVPMAINYAELADIAHFANENGIHQVSWLRFVPQGRGAINRNLLNLSVIQLNQLSAAKEEINVLTPDVKIRTGSPYNVLCPDSPTPCEAGISLLTINPDGTVAPCDAFKRFKINDVFGNILDQSLQQVWERSCFLNSVRRTLESKDKSVCSKCDFYSLCQSGCLAQTAIEGGEIIMGRDPDCHLDLSAAVRNESEAIAV